jgi:hypothetical protein
MSRSRGRVLAERGRARPTACRPAPGPGARRSWRPAR